MRIRYYACVLVILAMVLTVSCGGGSDDEVTLPPGPESGDGRDGGDPPELDTLGIPQGDFVLPTS